MTSKYILRIQTDNPFLKERYTSKVNLEGDAGIDLYCPTRLEIVNGSRSNKIDFQIRCQLVDREGKSYSYLLMPRSSVVKTPLRMTNSIGLIDSGYTNFIMAFVDNVQELVEDPSLERYTIEAGDRLFQIVAPGLEGITVELVDSLPETQRGMGGFGSTGR
jgi:dUTP pyrophosphatase